MPADCVPAGDVAHVTLRLGRLMLVNGADTAHVQEAVIAFARRLGYQAHLLVWAEALLLTLEDREGFRTKLGPTIPSMTVNMGALAALEEVRRQALATTPDIAVIDRRLDQLERAGSGYPHWLVALGMGITAASLARLFGGAWPVVGVSVLVGIATQLLRQWLGGSSTNPIAGAALAAFVGGLVGAVVMKAFPDTSPTLCLVAAGMILVPGVPLLNGVRDTLGNHIGTGMSRLMLGTVTVLSIALGLFVAASIAGDMLPVGGTLDLLPLGQDLLFSAFAGGGYALLFNVPARPAWVCVICAMVGHGLRTALEHLGLDLTVGSLVGAFAATLLARFFAQRFTVPTVTFAFPGVVAMIPGSYAFRAGIGGLTIMHTGATAPAALIGDTIGLAVTAILVTAAIAIGLCLALAVPLTNPTSQTVEAIGGSR